jgi:hypothetical protein
VNARGEEFATAGASARADGRPRRKKLRENRRDCATLLILGVVSLTTVVLTEDHVQLSAAALLGFVIGIGVLVWLVGDVRAFPSIWGTLGEQETAAVLGRVGAGWYAIHDVPRSSGNWDHVCVGPAGVFLLETKNLSRPAVVSDDTLRSGHTAYRGVRFRRAAMELREEIQRRGVRCPYVHAGVVLWGEFEQRVWMEKGTTYVAGDELLDWLRRRSATLSESQVASLCAAISAVAADPGRAPTSVAATV